MAEITFGTDGWRAVMGKEFTLDNVRAVAQAIADYMKDHGLESRGVIVGYDTRRWSRRFADAVCRVMLGNKISTCITNRDTPTPVTAFEVLRRKAGGAVMITASHNPPEWNGIKYIPEYAGPALPDITEEITSKISRVLSNGTVKQPSGRHGFRAHLHSVNPLTSYAEFVMSQIDLEAMKKARLKVVCDVMYGTARGYLDRILRGAGCEVTVIHNEIDHNFGGSRPEPLPNLLAELKRKVASLNAALGLATDGDADRLAVYDSNGTYFGANQLFPILFDRMIRDGHGGGAVRTVATTHLVDRIAQKYKLPVYEVPVGFKYVSQYLRERDVVIGGEESGGFSFKGHVPEKDGIFTSIKVTEIRAKTGKTLSQLLGELQSEFGPFSSGRVQVSCPDEVKQVVMQKLLSEVPDKVGSTKVSKVTTIDGIKLVLEDGGWLLIRPSGTEPILRIYGESTDRETLNEILKQGKKLVTTTLSRLK